LRLIYDYGGKAIAYANCSNIANGNNLGVFLKFSL